MPDGAHNHLHLVKEVLARPMGGHLRVRPRPSALISNTRKFSHEGIRRLDVGIHAAFPNPFGGIALVVNVRTALRTVHEMNAHAVGILGRHFTVDKGDDRLGPQMADRIRALSA